jgi:alkylated DNA nucleotide flippase Atl1
MQFYTCIYALVRQIPPGKEVTYGQVAALLGKP